jgi:hypothetical protein
VKTVEVGIFWGSSVNILTRIGLNDRDSISGSANEESFSPPCADRLWSPPSLLFNERRVSFPGGRAGAASEADYSPPSSTEVLRMHGSIHLLS